MPERKLAHLLGGDIRQRRLAPAERGGPQPAHGFDVVLALFVVDAHAFPALNDQGPGFTEFHEVCVRMQDAFDVTHLRV